MRGHAERETVLVMINGALTSVKGLKKGSTCNDVISMATVGVTMEGKSDDVLALFESSNGEDRLLSPGTNIWKVIRSWGNDTSYSLVLKPTDCMQAKMATTSRTKRNLQKLRSVMSSKKSTANTNDMKNCMKSRITKALGEFQADKLCEKKGKLALFHRYIRDVLCHRTKYSAATSHHTNDQSGSACTFHQNSEVPTDGSYTPVSDCNDAYTIYSGEENIDDYNEYLDLNMAFVDEALANADKLHCEVLNEMIDTSKSITSDESGFGEDSVCSIDELEKNVFDCDLDVTIVHNGGLQEGLTLTKKTVIKHQRVKSIFTEGVSNIRISSLDDAISSFMNTLSSLPTYRDSGDALGSGGSEIGSV